MRARYALTVAAAVLAVAVSFVAIRERGGDGPREPLAASAGGHEDAGGFEITPPGSLAELSAKADVVVMGTVGKRIETHSVSLGQSAPLGEQGKTFAASIEIASYEVYVDRYISGPGERTITLQHPVNLSANGTDPGMPVEGDTGIFFLSPAVEWKLGGYASYFGRYGRLVERNGAVSYGGADAQRPAFAEGRTLAQIADAVR